MRFGWKVTRKSRRGDSVSAMDLWIPIVDLVLNSDGPCSRSCDSKAHMAHSAGWIYHTYLNEL